MAYIVCEVKDVGRLTIIEFENSLVSDKNFIESFSDNYLGAINSKIKKKELIELASLIFYRENIGFMESKIDQNFTNFENIISDSGFNEKDFRDFENLYWTSIKPIDDWIKNKNFELSTQISKLSSIIVRGY